MIENLVHFWLMFWLGCTALAGIAAMFNRRSAGLFLACGLLIGPLVVLIMVLGPLAVLGAATGARGGRSPIILRATSFAESGLRRVNRPANDDPEA